MLYEMSEAGTCGPPTRTEFYRGTESLHADILLQTTKRFLTFIYFLKPPPVGRSKGFARCLLPVANDNHPPPDAADKHAISQQHDVAACHDKKNHTKIFTYVCGVWKKIFLHQKDVAACHDKNPYTPHSCVSKTTVTRFEDEAKRLSSMMLLTLGQHGPVP